MNNVKSKVSPELQNRVTNLDPMGEWKTGEEVGAERRKLSRIFDSVELDGLGDIGHKKIATEKGLSEVEVKDFIAKFVKNAKKEGKAEHNEMLKFLFDMGLESKEVLLGNNARQRGGKV